MSDPDLERAVLKLAFETDVPLTAASVAYHLGVRVEVAKRELDALASQGALVLDSDEFGNFVYHLAGHARAQHRAPAAPLPTPRRRRRWAYAMNALVPGAGTLAVGRPLAGALQAAVVVTTATLLMMFWKDFGDSEHRPWLIVMAAVHLGVMAWSMTSVRAADRTKEP